MKTTNSTDKAGKQERRSKSAYTAKRIIFYLIMILPVILFSCESTPEAQFAVDTITPVVGQDVYFTNKSDNATRFEWDFGDGYGSSEPDPVHYYTASGSYEAELTAFSKSGLSDKSYITIDVQIPSILVIEVLEYFDGYPVSDASVLLYPSITAWIDQENSVVEGFTESNGQVVFSHLDYQEYYVDVWEEHHNNYTLAEEDEGFIITDKLAPNTVTYFIAWVDYFETTKSDGTRDRTMVIKKLERKAEDKSRDIDTSEDWQTLYEKSIKVK